MADGRLMRLTDAAVYIGFAPTNRSSLYKLMSEDPLFPRPIRRPVMRDGLPVLDAQNQPRLHPPVWDRVDLDAWIERQKAPERQVAAEVERLRSLAGRARAEKRWARRSRSAS